MKLINTGLLIVVFFWFWPVRLFTKKNNCYFWTLEQLITKRGKIEWYPSRRWAGYHVVWIDEDNVAWEYTRKLRKTNPWYSMIFYNGHVRKFRGKRKYNE